MVIPQSCSFPSAACPRSSRSHVAWKSWCTEIPLMPKSPQLESALRREGIGRHRKRWTERRYGWGNVAVGCADLGSFSKPHYDKARGRKQRQLVQNEVQAEVEEDRLTKMVGMRQNGAWTRWENAEQCKITWAELWSSEPQCIKFLISSVYDLLPSPSNLHTAGACRLTSMLTVPKEWHTEAYPQLLSKGIGGWAVSLVPWTGHQGFGRYNHRSDSEQ